MPRPHPRPKTDDRPEDSSVAWFASMALAIERGDFQLATEAQRELRRLGWSVMQTKPRPAKGGGA
jgi:hypothetical protein